MRQVSTTTVSGNAQRRGGASPPMVLLLVGITIIVAGTAIARPVLDSLAPGRWLTIADSYPLSSLTNDDRIVLTEELSDYRFMRRVINTRAEYESLGPHVTTIWQPEIRAVGDEFVILNDQPVDQIGLDDAAVDQLRRDIYAQIEYEVGCRLITYNDWESVRQGASYIDMAQAVNPALGKQIQQELRKAIETTTNSRARSALLYAIVAAKEGERLSPAVNRAADSRFSDAGR